MTSSIMPVSLTGSSLGDRHRDFNLLVNRATQNNMFKDIESWPEISPIDRIFKIDFASKHRNIDYILQNLKDSDMLYVSRSLKCLWVLDPQYHTFVNPDYLENSLYPDMIQPAVHKMKHWLTLNLKETERCKEFYQYYKSDFNASVKFLWHCSSEFILSEVPNIIEKISYKHLNLILETCPQAGELYFEMLPNNPSALSNYLKDEYNYFICLKHLLRWNGDLFLDIIEKYFNISRFNPFGPSLTKHIMKQCKKRVLDKCELYVSSVLHVNTFATHLTEEEAKDIVMKLAQAEYLKHWFSYQKVEPLIKRLQTKDRTEFKKQIFDDKCVLSKVEEWPYPLPSPLQLDEESDNKIFDDISDEPYMYAPIGNIDFRCRIKKKSCRWNQNYVMCSAVSGKSPLDILFNRYRVIGFERTFYELSKNLKSESSHQGRLNMMLVLVSKTGGVPTQVEKLLKLLVESYKNEPTTLRAAVIRSLMKRCSAWRLPEDIWARILEFGRDVGLDGLDTTPLCREGLHAVIIRYLLNDKPMSSILVSGFMREFSNLSEYNLSASERQIIAHRLPLLILPLNPNSFLDCLTEYKKGIEAFPEAKTILFKAAKEDSDLLQRMYNSKILRLELFNETFCLNQSDEAYLNVLRHDVTPLENGQKFAQLSTEKRPKHDRFLRSLNLYFSEADGLAEKHRKALEEAFERNPQPWLARPLCILMNDQALLLYVSALEAQARPLTLNQFQSLHALRANAHKTKPSLDINSIDWKWIGAKAVSNKVLICRLKDRDNYLEKLLQWGPTRRIALRLSSDTPTAVDNFVTVCALRPLVALKVALSFYLTKTYIDPVIWNAIKPIIKNKCTSKNKLLTKLSDLDSVPVNIEADYWVFVYSILTTFDKNEAMPILCRLDNMLHKVDPTFCTEVIKEYIQNINLFKITQNKDRKKKLYLRIIAKYLLLYPDDTENICANFFNTIEVLCNEIEDKNEVLNYMDDFVFALKYSKAFLDQDYSALINVFDVILKRLQVIFPAEQFFGMYVDIHLTMLYLKSIKQAMKKCENVCEDSKDLKVVELVGHLFGKYIGYEIKEVVSRYFYSVIDLYKMRLKRYLREYFIFNKGRSHLVTFVIKGLIDMGTIESLILAEHLTDSEHRYNICEPYKEEIIKVLKESQYDEVKYFFYADILKSA